MNATIIAPAKASHWGLEWRLATVKNGMKDSLAYRGDFIIGLLSQAFVPVAIQLMLWYSIFKNGGATTFAGMSYSELLAYTWTSILFTQIRGGDYDFALIEMIRTGTLSGYLVRPVGVVEFTFFQGLGEKLITAGFCLTLGVVATFFTSMTITNLILAIMLAIVGNIIHYLFGAALASVAFYWENAFAVLMVKNMVVSLLCGEVIPLSIVPAKYTFIWESLPFYLFVYGPTQVALGKWDQLTWLRHMGIGFIWIFVLWGALKLSWSYSIKRYQGIGG
ncbi:MAG: ABC-2 family transporter protein [Bdellovibrionales bacterium]|nr:ABC-2 family transporter protein [Oligoflexia bacterium]